MNRHHPSYQRPWLYLLLVIGAAVLCACGPVDDSKAPLRTFNIPALTDPKHLDPAFVYDIYEITVSGYLYDGLVNFGLGAEVEPGLAEKWDLSPDRRTYTFHLRDAKFSNGKPVTSADVRYSFTRILQADTVSDRKWIFDKVVGADQVTSGIAKELPGLQTPDPKTVIVTLTKPYPAFLTKLAMPNAAIIPEGSAGRGKPDRSFDKNPIGSGPWVLQKWLRDQRLMFRPNPFYWGGKPKLDQLIYTIQNDDDVQRRQFQAGVFDSYIVGYTVYSRWCKDPARKDLIKPVPLLNTYCIGMMCNKPKLADKRVRQAISHAVNTRAIFDYLQQGRGELAHGSVPPGIKGYRPELKPREYNPEKARRLLAEAGAKNLTLDLWFGEDALTVEMMSAAANDLRNVGIQVNTIRRDWPATRQAIYNGQPDLYFSSWWLDYPAIENALVPSFASWNIPRSGNGCHFSNSEFDRLAREADEEPDPDRQILKYQACEDLIREECPWVFLYHMKNYIINQPWVKGFVPSLMINADKFVDVDIDLSRKPR